MSNRVTVDCAEGLSSPDWLGRVEPFAQKALEALGVDGWELSIMICDDPFIKSLNSTYRGIDARPTSSPSSRATSTSTTRERRGSRGRHRREPWRLARNCEDFSVSLDEELKRLLVHGMLHLTGWTTRTTRLSRRCSAPGTDLAGSPASGSSRSRGMGIIDRLLRGKDEEFRENLNEKNET
jgi:probable rRNA maturation factor